MSESKQDLWEVEDGVKKGWEARFAGLTNKEYGPAITADFQLSHMLFNLTTIHERRRLKWKLELVKEEALKMALAMLKGTIKYESDDISPEEWDAHAESERIDQNNYLLLKRHAERKIAEEEKDDESRV